MTLRGLIGVVHLPAMPGDPRATLGFDAVVEHAARDAEALAAADALIVENFGSAPFPKGTAGDRLPPHQVACLGRAVRRAVEVSGKPVGVNCLRNDAPAAIGIAAASGASFVRVNVLSGAYVTDQGLIEGEAAHLLRYRASLGAASIAILADVLVKHATPLAPLDAGHAAVDLLERSGADGVIVTGAATGAAIDLELLKRVRAAVGKRPLYAGSGVTPAHAERIAPLCQGAIVGTYLKSGGDVRAPVDRTRVEELAAALRGRFAP